MNEPFLQPFSSRVEMMLDRNEPQLQINELPDLTKKKKVAASIFERAHISRLEISWKRKIEKIKSIAWQRKQVSKYCTLMNVGLNIAFMI